MNATANLKKMKNKEIYFKKVTAQSNQFKKLS